MRPICGRITSRIRSVGIEMAKNDGPKVTRNASTAAERQRRYRDRKRQGAVEALVDDFTEGNLVPAGDV